MSEKFFNYLYNHTITYTNIVAKSVPRCKLNHNNGTFIKELKPKQKTTASHRYFHISIHIKQSIYLFLSL